MKRMTPMVLILIAPVFQAPGQIPPSYAPPSFSQPAPVIAAPATAGVAGAFSGPINGFVAEGSYIPGARGRHGELSDSGRQTFGNCSWSRRAWWWRIPVSWTWPYVGRTLAVGKTPKQLAAEIKALLEKDYYKQATVVLSLNLANRLWGRVYILGQVHLQGALDVQVNENLTAGKAILRAGGFLDFANKKKRKNCA